MVRLGAFAAFGLCSLAMAAEQTVKVMPFGASIVTRCWRNSLQKKLKDAGVTNFDMVGSQTGSSTCLTQFPDTDNDHEGHSGSLASDYAANGNLTRWLDAQPTVDVVIMFLGHNDILFGKRSQETILKAYDTLLAQMRSKNPKMQIVWSNLTPVSPEKFDDAKAAGIKALSAKIKEIAPGKSTKDSPVRFVNNYEGYVASSDTEDGLHPNNVGNEKMASKFVGATRDAILAASPAGTFRAQRDEFAGVVKQYLDDRRG